MDALHGWQQTGNPASSAKALRLALGALLVGLCISFVAALRTPFDRPGLQTVVLSPSTWSASSAVNEQASTVLDRDIAGLLCQVSGAQLEQLIDQSLPESLVTVAGKSLKQKSNSLEKQLATELRTTSTVIVYLSGVLSIENGQPALCDSSHESVHGGGEVELLPLIDALQHASCRQILLCMDLVPPATLAPAVISAPLIVEQLAESIEQQLAEHEGCTPLAVCISMTTVDQSLTGGSKATPLSLALTEAWQQELSTSQFNLHRLKGSLAASLTALPELPKPILLTSIHWPAASKTLPLLAKSPIESVADAPSTASSTVQSDSKREAIADVNAAHGASSGEQLNPSLSQSELWQIGRQALAALDQTPTDENVGTSASWLPLPASLTYAQRRPHADALLRQSWQQLEAVRQLAPECVLVESLRSVTQSLALAAYGTPLPHGSPAHGSQVSAWPWVPTKNTKSMGTTDSLILNNVLGHAGVLDKAITGHSLELLNQLTQAIDQATDAAQLTIALETLSKSTSKQYVELYQCRLLLSRDLPWPILHRVLRLQLVSQRVHDDLFQDDPSVARLLTQADHTLGEVRSAIDSWSDQESSDELNAIIDRAFKACQATLVRMDLACARELQQQSRGVQALKARAWGQFSALSNRSAIHALNNFESCWQQLINDQKPLGQIQLADQFAVARRLLEDSNAPTAKQIEAIRQLSRRVLAATEDLQVAQSPQAGSLSNDAQPERKSTAGIELFACLVSPIHMAVHDDVFQTRVKELTKNSSSRTRFVSVDLSANRTAARAQSTPPPQFLIELMVDNGSADNQRTAGQGGQVARALRLQANRPQAIELYLEQLKPEIDSSIPMLVSVQVWGSGGPLNSVPVGMLTAQAAERWLLDHSRLVLLASANSIAVDATDRRSVPLRPTEVAIAAAAKAPTEALLAGFVVAITDQATQRVQLQAYSFHVQHPHEYVQQQVTLDVDRQVVTIHIQLDEHASASAVTVAQRLVEWPQQTLLAEATSLLTSHSPQSQVVLSSSRHRGQRLALITDVDGWPGSFVTPIDPQQGVLSSPIDAIASVRLRTNCSDAVQPLGADEVEVEVMTLTSASPTESMSELWLGWDRDQDRTFSGEQPMKLSSQPSVQISCSGVDTKGLLLISNRIGPQHVKLSTTGFHNERASVLAMLQQDGRMSAAATTAIIVDSQPPNIVRTRVRDGAHSLLGATAIVDVTVNDHGLAGVAQVEAAWSLSGQLQLNESMKPLPGVVRSDGTWVLSLPTATLPSGDNSLLIHAIDKAGNFSDTYAVTVSLQTQAELDAMAASQLSSVSGVLMFANVPQGGLQLDLLKVVPASDTTKTPTEPMAKLAPVPDESIVGTTKSQANGSFRLSDVPTGAYTLRVKGIVRGMRFERSQSMIVEAPKSPPPILWRLDKQP